MFIIISNNFLYKTKKSHKETILYLLQKYWEVVKILIIFHSKQAHELLQSLELKSTEHFQTFCLDSDHAFGN